MASQTLFPCLLTLFISSLHLLPVKSDDAKLPDFAFSWLNDNDTFTSGDTATIKVKVLGYYEADKYQFPFSPNITVNDKMGNSSFVSGVRLDFDGGTENWRIVFTPILVGLFNVLITDDHFRVFDASMHFQVNPGKLYPAAAIASWTDGLDEFIAGSRAELLILPKDAFGNNVSLASEGSKVYNFTLYASLLDGSPATVLNITENGWDNRGFLTIEFVAATAGSLLLHLETENQTLQGSPLPFKVNPGELDVRSCMIQWDVETRYFQLFSVMEAFIHQYDRYGNLVSGQYAFDVEVVEKGINLSMPVGDLSFKEISTGIQSFTFSLQEPGSFTLMIFDKEQNTLISNAPYDFTVYIAYCDGRNSIVNGSGLNTSTAGEVAKFSVYLKDTYLYPSPVELGSLQVQILHESDNETIHPSIQIKGSDNGSLFSEHFDNREIDPTQIVSTALTGMLPSGNVANRSSTFEVIFQPEKSGTYGIRVCCGNIPLNGGRPFRKEVSPGVVNVSHSGVVKFAEKVPKLAKQEIVVQLLDSYFNPIVLQESKLKLEIASINKSGFSVWKFDGNNNGSYTVSYLAKDVGTYEMCASYDEVQFMPCPFGVHVYNSEYFPKVNNDTVSVWEDESIAFDVLENDYFAGGNASIVEYSKPSHGSLLQYGNLFRFTPYKRFYGNDSFSYTMSDINGNLGSGVVHLLVLCMPPQFLSIPSDLQATEDTINPTFGGFYGFQLIYSDLEENITVTLNSQSGTVSLSPMPMQFWKWSWNKIYVEKEVGQTNELTLVGCTDAINFALQSIQFIGNENFYGATTIRLSTQNRNGMNYVDVPIFVHPMNDPPVINIPSFIVLNHTHDGILIFGGKGDKFDFIVDPDLMYFPGNRSRFLVMLSLEVSSGRLSTTLPAELIGSTEVKLTTSYHWQPLQTFVTISKHFFVKAKGIRFRGSVDVCNSIIQQLSYHEGKHGSVLTVLVNDLGNHGCYPNCGEMMSTSLFSESIVNLINEKPMSSLAAHILGSAIIIVSSVLLFLALVLLFFICKCARVLVHEKKRQKSQDIELSKVQGPGSTTQTLDVDASEKERLLDTAWFSVPFWFNGQTSNSQRSHNTHRNVEESDHSLPNSSSSSGDQNKRSHSPDIQPTTSDER